MLHRTDGRWRIRRETSERKHPATIVGTVQAGVPEMFTWYSLFSLIIVEGTMDQYKFTYFLADHVHPICVLFFFGIMASTSRTVRSVIQLAVYVRDSKSIRENLSFLPGQKTQLTLIQSRMCGTIYIGLFAP
ncbi:transposable element Tcb1 transposase [Trichonephila clavipes]|nr:transposable element Tcb1 transposase [Trichonephila clavipes]